LLNETDKLPWSIILIMGICPPWKRIIKLSNSYRVRSAGYHFLFMPPEGRSRGNVTIDLQRLFLQWFLVVVAGAITIVILRKEDEGMTTNQNIDTRRTGPGDK